MQTLPEKSIVYDRETKDFAMYLDAELVGFARTHQEAEETLDALVYEILTTAYGPTLAPPAEELAAAPAEAPAAPVLKGSSIAHVDPARLEIHGQVILGEPIGGIRRVWFGTPACCVSVCNVTGKKVYSNAITGERIGGLARLIAHAERVGPREFARVNA